MLSDKDIEYLNSLPENSEQVLKLNLPHEQPDVLFLWFFGDGIDIRIPGNIQVIHIQRQNWSCLDVVY